MKIKDLRTKNSAELLAMLSDLKKESFNLRFQRASGSMPKTSRIREVKRAIARVSTLQNEMKLKLELEVKNA